VSEQHESGDEVARIRRVYEAYETTPGVSARWSSSNPGNRMIVDERDLMIRRLLQEHGFWPLGDARMVDIGCGSGGFLRRLESWGALPERIVGVDVFEPYLDEARSRQPNVRFVLGSAEVLPLEADGFDVASVFTVFSSILDDSVARAVAASIARVLRPGGAVLWYDLRYPNPFNRANVHSVRRAEIAALFPGFVPHLRTVTVLPQLARRLGRTTDRVYRMLAAAEPLRTHYVGLLTKPAR